MARKSTDRQGTFPSTPFLQVSAPRRPFRRHEAVSGSRTHHLEPPPMSQSRLQIASLVPFAALVAAPASAQQFPVFSIDWNGPTISLPNSFTGAPITEGDLLAANPLVPAFGPLPTPGIVETAGFVFPVGLGLGWHAPCVGHPAYTPCRVEVDALSHGLDALIRCTATGTAPGARQWAFSVRTRSAGIVGTPAAPTVWTEGPCQDDGADVFVDLGVNCGPLAPTAPFAGSTGYVDGNGMPSCSGAVYPGTGLIENPPGAIHGDNLDALDDNVPDRAFASATCTYFSLDSAFVDPVTGIPNSGSAVANGFVGGDVLRSCPGCAPAVYATALQLGLGSNDQDDLDALALRENGVAGYQRSFGPYDWTSGQTDMLFFSVRRGSAIIGVPDAFFGLPISEADILVPTGPLGSVPGIWIAGENLGLRTQRIATAFLADDLDALDTLHLPEVGTRYCFGDGTGTACPCANSGAAGRGCANSQRIEGAILWSNGNPSLSNDTVHMAVSGMTANATTLLYQGTLALVGVPFGDGLRCVSGNTRRLYQRTALCGNREYGNGVPFDAPLSVQGNLVIPGTVHYQVQYRDSSPTFCSVPALFNFSNGYRLVWGP